MCTVTILSAIQRERVDQEQPKSAHIKKAGLVKAVCGLCWCVLGTDLLMSRGVI